MAWEPEYPGQEREPVWVWWERDEPENGLLGFHTAEDCDRFSAGGEGPFRRRIAADGKTISQTETWSDFIDRLKSEEEELK